MKIDSFDRSQMIITPADPSSIADKTEDAAEKTAVQEVKNISSINPIEKKAMPVSEKVVIEAIEKANKAINGARTEFKFSIHKQTHEISVKVLDKDSGEVIREIPPDKVLDMVARLWEMAGIVVDERR